MPTPFIKRYQKHVTIKLKKGEKIQIVSTPKGVSLLAHPLDEANRRNPEYANISLMASDVLGVHRNRNDMDEKIDQVLSSLNIVNDNVKDSTTEQMTDPNRHKRGTANLYFYESPELDGEYDYIRSKLIKVRNQHVPKEEIKRVNDIFINKLGYDHGLAENTDRHIMGELYSDNNV